MQASVRNGTKLGLAALGRRPVHSPSRRRSVVPREAWWLWTASTSVGGRSRSRATTATRRASRSLRSRVGSVAHKQPSRHISTIRPAIGHARSRRATGEGAAAAGRPPRHGTVRVTPTRIANAAIPALSRRNGHGTGFATRCAPGERATALSRPRMTGRARTPARRRTAQTTTSRRMARAVHCHRSVRELGEGTRRRLQRRLSVRASMPVTYERALALGRL
jgi:hypothetical protein